MSNDSANFGELHVGSIKQARLAAAAAHSSITLTIFDLFELGSLDLRHQGWGQLHSTATHLCCWENRIPTVCLAVTFVCLRPKYKR
jgi:hypothetical protein